MKLRILLSIGVAACVLTLATTQVMSQEKETTKGFQQKQAQMDEQTAAWMKAAEPGPNHKLLDCYVGKWNITCQHWMEPGAEVTESRGYCESNWVLGGRYVETRYRGEFMEKPFKGIGFVGYDNIQKKFTSVWIDNLGTGIMVEEGTYDAAKKEFTYRGEFTCPEGQTIKSQTTIRIIDDDKHIMTMYHATPDSDEPFKVMEITYTRIAGSKGPRPE